MSALYAALHVLAPTLAQASGRGASMVGALKAKQEAFREEGATKAADLLQGIIDEIPYSSRCVKGPTED